MAFLDNSGDIILDAVLTDTGRARLAKGDGTFKIAKFALADDEIDYQLYDSTAEEGTPYYDLNILTTPILEAFTNNTSSMKSKLISIPRTNLLYLPSMKLNQEEAINKVNTETNNFVVAVDSTTEEALTAAYRDGKKGILLGRSVAGQNASHIRVDQGIESDQVEARATIDPDLKETQYIVEIDNRFGSIASTGGGDFQFNFLDDDQIASYYFSSASELVTSLVADTGDDPNLGHVIKGPKGTTIRLYIKASTGLRDSTYLFDKFGNSDTLSIVDSDDTPYKYIDSIVRITGATTGSSIDLQIRFIKITGA